MVLSGIIIIILLFAFTRGYKIGLLRTFIRLIGRIIIFTVAILLAHRIGSWFATNLLSGANAQYGATSVPHALTHSATEFMASGVAFGLLTMVGFFILRSVENGVKFLNKIPLLGWVNKILGALLNLLIMYVLVFFVLQIFQTWSVPSWQNQLSTSTLAQWMMNETPYLSHAIYEWWLAQ